MTDYKHIPVKPDTAERIHNEKRYGETWDEFIRRLADESGGHEVDSCQ